MSPSLPATIAPETKRGSLTSTLSGLGLLLMMVIWGSGCAWLVAPPQDQGDARAMLKRLSTQNQQLHTFKGLLKVGLKTEGSAISGRVALAAALPDRIRADWLSPLGQPVSGLAANGETVTVTSYQDKKHYRFEQTPTALKLLIKVPMGVDDFLELLSGRPILPEFSAAQMTGNSDAPTILLKNRWRRTVADLELDADGRLVAQRIFNTDNVVHYSILWKRWNARGAYTLPSRITMTSSAGESVDIVVDRFWPDVDVGPSMFDLPVDEP